MKREFEEKGEIQVAKKIKIGEEKRETKETKLSTESSDSLQKLEPTQKMQQKIKKELFLGAQ